MHMGLHLNNFSVQIFSMPPKSKFLAVRELGDDIFDAELLGGKVYQAPLTKTLPDIRQLVLGTIDALWRGDISVRMRAKPVTSCIARNRLFNWTVGFLIGKVRRGKVRRQA
jgi:hypothetical protein